MRMRAAVHIGGAHKRDGSGWKWAFLVLLVLVLAGAGIGAAYFQMNRHKGALMTTASPVVVAETRQAAIQPVSDEAVDKPPSLAGLSRQELMDRLPQNLLRRFHSGDPGQGLPDDLRIVAAPKGECVVLLGSGRLEGGPRTPVERILILRFEEDEFRDVTRQLVPAAYASGTITGRGAQVKFSETGNKFWCADPRLRTPSFRNVRPAIMLIKSSRWSGRTADTQRRLAPGRMIATLCFTWLRRRWRRRR